MDLEGFQAHILSGFLMGWDWTGSTRCSGVSMINRHTHSVFLRFALGLGKTSRYCLVVVVAVRYFLHFIHMEGSFP